VGTTSQPGEVPAGSEKVPVREPVSEPFELQPPVVETVPTLKLAADGRQQPVISTLAYASEPSSIPTLVSSGPGAQVGLGNRPPRASEFVSNKPVVHDYCVGDYQDEMYCDDNIDPYNTKHVVRHRVFSHTQWVKIFYR